MPASECTALNLGSGADTHPQMWDVDIEPLDGVDEVVDLDNTPWPWDEDSFAYVQAYHVLEHLEDPNAALKEIERVLEPGGELVLKYPIGHTRFEDSTHRHFWNYNTAAALAGERKHSHEVSGGLSLVDRRVEVAVGGLSAVYTRVRRQVSGDGPWLSQVPGLSGEVIARYKA